MRDHDSDARTRLTALRAAAALTAFALEAESRRVDALTSVRLAAEAKARDGAGADRIGELEGLQRKAATVSASSALRRRSNAQSILFLLCHALP